MNSAPVRIFLVLASLAFAGCSSSPTQNGAAVNPIPLRDFFRNPERTRYLVSPDGRYLSFLQSWNSRLNVFIQPLSSEHLPQGEIQQITFVKDRDISTYSWKGKNTILYSRDFGGDENFHIFAVNLQGQARDLTPFPHTRALMLDDLEESSDSDILIQMNKRNPELFEVYRCDVVTGEIKLVAQNPGKYTGWVVDHAGHVRIAIESDGLQSQIYTRKTDQDPFRRILKFDYTNEFNPLFFTPDNREFFAASNLNRERTAIVRIDPVTGKEQEVLYEHPEVDVSALEYSPKRRMVTTLRYTTWKDEFKFFDTMSEWRYKKVKAQIPNMEIYFVGHNRNEDLFTVLATNDKTRGHYYLYDEANDRLTFLTDASPWLKAPQLADMRPIRYTARDGLVINGYLTLPKGKMEKNLPVIVNPHGGPWARDVWRFNPEVQFLANRGYAVLQMNYRGSIGYGKTSFKLSFKQWGRTMQDDITDGVKWLIAQGIADPKRVGIYGGSYGGYATLAGIAFTPELYACAVDYVGVANLLTFMKTIPPYWKPELEKYHAMVGDPEKDLALMRAASPVFHVDRIRAPLFVAQGAKDPRVNINESNQIVDSLRKRGVNVQYMVKENEGHGFRNEENRFDFYEAMEKFLAQHL
ncbi:MAG: S9 family peptidase [Bdellovibrionales bacterium]|nr:S9 family peptidase [Bdellovibrionales bacterium]